MTFSEVISGLITDLERSIAQSSGVGQSFAQLTKLVEQLAMARQVASNGGGYGSESTLESVLSTLEQIRAHVDGLEPTIGNLNINSDTLNINTDGIEAALNLLNDAIGTAGNDGWVSGNGTLVSLLKAIAARTATAAITNGVITTGGNAQVLAGASQTAVFAELQNNSAGDLWINEGALAGIDAGLRIPAGAYWHSEPNHAPRGDFSIFGATTGQKFAWRRA